MGLEAAGRSVDQTVGSVANKVKGKFQPVSDSYVMVVIKWIFLLFLGYHALIDLPVALYQLLINTGPLGCKTDDWASWGFISLLAEPSNDCEEGETDGPCGDLGKWKSYSKDKKNLCPRDVDKIYKDAISEKKFGKYTTTELFSYIIIPTVTLLSIAYALIFTTGKPADFIFWIGVATLIYTGVSTLTYTTNIDILPPDQPSPLLYVTDKLNLAASDELKYSFMARKSDGSECLVEGTMLGGGIHSPNNPIRYTGFCTDKDLPLE